MARDPWPVRRACLVLCAWCLAVAPVQAQEPEDVECKAKRAEVRRVLREALEAARTIEDKDQQWVAVANIAHLQAAADPGSSLEAVTQLVGNHGNAVLESIAMGQARAGDLASAIASIEQITDLDARERAVFGCATAAAEEGHIAVALELAVRLPDEPSGSKATILKDVAMAQARAGAEGAGGTLARAVDLVLADRFPLGEQPEPDDVLRGAEAMRRVERLAEVGGAQASIGDGMSAKETFRKALEVISGIQDHPSEISARSALAAAQADAGEIGNATATIEPVSHEREGGWIPFIGVGGAYERIAAALARRGDVSGALRLVTEQQEARDRARVLIQVTLGQAEGGDRVGALQTLQSAVEEAVHVEGGFLRAGAFRDVATAQAKLGDMKAANLSFGQAEVEVLSEEDEDLKDNGLADLAVEKVFAGDYEGALQTATRIQSERTRAEALETIAQGQTLAGDSGKAESWVMREASALTRTQALIGIASGLLGQPLSRRAYVML